MSSGTTSAEACVHNLGEISGSWGKVGCGALRHAYFLVDLSASSLASARDILLAPCLRCNMPLCEAKGHKAQTARGNEPTE